MITLFYFAAFFLGGTVGIAELVSRYRDSPLRALRTLPSLLYFCLNASASLLALALVREFGWLQNDGPDGIRTILYQTLASGTSAMALFRTSLFTVRVGNSDIGIGPAAFLQIILSAADRACDRTCAKPRAIAVQKIMKDISFARARQALPALCFGLMQNVSNEEQRAFGTVVTQLEAAQMEDVFKANNLGLALLNVVGETVLGQAVTMLREDIREPPHPIVQSLATLQLLPMVDFNASAVHIVNSCVFLGDKIDDTGLREQLVRTLAEISAMTVPDRQKMLMLATVLIRQFGEETFQTVLRALPETATV